jgi:hypothetical protein
MTTAAAASAVSATAGLSAAAQGSAQTASESDRDYWVRVLTRISEPVLVALSQRKLVELMPVDTPMGSDLRRHFAYLEAVGDVIAGIGSWLESGDKTGPEGKLRQRYAELSRQAIAASVDPASPDFMNFTRSDYDLSVDEPICNAACLVLGVLRAPTELWEKLDAATKSNLVKAIASTRVFAPMYTNHLLFNAIMEAFLGLVGEEWDAMRVDYAVRQFELWYVGDGMYSDGPRFHWDHYNSYVIQPMLLATVEAASKAPKKKWVTKKWDELYPAMIARAKRYAAVQERLIAPDGSYPAYGRSITYRYGAFQVLSDMALRHQLPEGVLPEQVRAALTAVIRRMTEAPGTFDAKGWLNVGFCGHQPSLAEPYVTTGSQYNCALVFPALGLPSTDPFWSNPAKPWTSQKMWSGQDMPRDHALD